MNRPRPTRWILTMAILALTSVTAWAAVLTKDDVVRMAREGRSDSEILGAIHDSHSTFDLTANDIADLRQAGLSQKVIDGMIATGTESSTDSAGSEPDQSSTDQQSSSDQGEPQGEALSYPYVAPVFYPVYPIYYPVYYPVYDPFFPVYGGFFFSFGFVHVSNLFSIFPCDRAIVVVNRPLFGTGFRPRWTAFARGGSASRATVRVIPRGSSPPVSIASRIEPRARGGESRITTPRTMRPQRAWRETRPAGTPSRPRAQGNPATRYQSAPRPSRPFQGVPRSPAQSFQRPGAFMAPRTGFAGRPQGAFSGHPAGGFSPRSFSGGGGGHMGGAGGHGHGGHH